MMVFRSFCVSVALAGFLAVPYPAFAQGGAGQGLIALPDVEPLQDLQLDPSALPGLDLLADGEDDRLSPNRRGFEGAPESGFSNWLSPLRLNDLQIRSRGSVARITGEQRLVNFDLYVGDPGAHSHLQIATQSSIDILPERSAMRVRVNGTEVGTLPLRHFEPGQVDKLDLPPGLLIAGRNQVQIDFRQSHRIFCGPQASFGLWTDLDVTRTGLLVETAQLADGAETFLMALAAQAASSDPIEIRGLDRLGPASDGWKREIVSRFNQSLQGDPVVFRFTDFWTVEGTRRAFARVSFLPSDQNRISYQTGGDGARVLVLEVAPDANPAQILEAIQPLAPQAKVARAVLVQPERPVSFAEMGIPSESFSQRYAFRDYPFRLPDDWLVLTAKKARINLDYIYATALPANSTLLISVNGVSVRLLPLRDEGGVAIEQFPIDFEARILQPGTNSLSFEVMIPGDPPNLPCPILDRPFLHISNTSTLTVPFSPAMAIPDMDMAFGALTPDSIRRNDMTARSWNNDDILTLQAALARTQAGVRPAILHLISMDDLASIPTNHHRPARHVLEDVLLGLSGLDDPISASLSQLLDDPFARRRNAADGGIGVSVRAAFRSGWQQTQEAMLWITDRALPGSGDQLNRWLSQRRAQAILFQLDPTRPEEIWMLRSPDSDIHEIAHSIAAARAFGRGPRGQVAILEHGGRWDNWIAPDRQPIMLEPISAQNFRYALGNIVSARPIFYTMLVLILAVLSSFMAMRLVISTREHKT